MSADEFSLIQRYFSDVGYNTPNCRLGIGDDAAVIQSPPGFQLVVCMDTLIEGVHFPIGTAAADVAIKALAVNLSDLAAMAADPDWFQLSLTLPSADELWLSEFAAAMKDMANRYQVDLVGGDTCRGPLSVTIQVAGLVNEDAYLTRLNAQLGDLIVVSGRLGDAALGLAIQQQKLKLTDSLAAECRARLNRPQPRLELNKFLRDHANAAIDVSDGLVADLGHVIKQSKVGARLRKNALPVNHWIKSEDQYDYALFGGDDYELCFTLPPAESAALQRWNSENPQCLLSIVGEIVDSGYVLESSKGITDLSALRGFKHFG